MRLGALLSPVDGNNPRALPDQAIELEGEGYSHLWMPQAMGRGFMLPDPFVALSAVAAVTTEVEIGTAILQLPLYNPVDIALKTYALSLLSDDRFILGVGAGSTASDYAIHQQAFAARFSDFNRCLQSLRDIFATGQVGDINLAPWESVRGGAPLFYGTWGKHVARAAQEFDGWIASGMHRSVDDCVAALADYRAAGGVRAMVSTLQITAGQDLGEFRERLARFAEAGFDDVVVMFMPGAPSAASIMRLIPDR